MESPRERLNKASARRRTKESFSGAGFPQASEERSNRKFFFIAAGSILVALVAFLCGVQMGKSLSELRGAEEVGSGVQDRKAKAPPFRLMDRGKEPKPVPEAKARASLPRERSEEREGSFSQPSPKVLNGKISGPEEERATPPRAKYTLQVAAFNNPTEAEELVNQLKKKGYDAYQVTGSAAAKGTLHRVRMGHFQSLQEARQFALTFEKKENMKLLISNVQNP